MSNMSVGVVDDHPLMVEALVSLLSNSDLQVVATGTTAVDVVNISTHHQPDVIVVDLSMAGDVYEAIAAVLRISPKTKVVAFTAATGVDSAIRALDAGASGYVLKGSSATELIKAIECVGRGETYITQAFASQVIAALRNAGLRHKAAQAVKLSIRENQIVRLLLRGKTNKEIATSLNISDKTVKHYMTILMQKLHARNRLEVVIAAQKFDQLAAEESFAAGGARLTI
jgi:DNA-binding NarL/FixJ family response regulator